MMYSYQLKSVPLEALLELYSEGNPDAFSEFYKRTNKLIYNFIKHKVSTSGDVDDVFQETYFRVHKYVATYDSSKKAITWLLSIALNCVRDYYRTHAKQKNLHSDGVVENLPSADRTDGDLDLKSLLSELAVGLDPDDLDILVKRVLHEESYDMLAKKYGLTQDNVRQRFGRIIRKLKIKMT